MQLNANQIVMFWPYSCILVIEQKQQYETNS